MVVKFPCKVCSKAVAIRIMPFIVIIGTFGYMLNAIRLTHKHVSFYKKSQQPGTPLML